MIFFIFFVTHAYIEREGHRKQRAKVRGWGVKGREKERGRGLGDRALSSEQPMPVRWFHMAESVYFGWRVDSGGQSARPFELFL